jgi:hypothetical protein
MTSRSNSQEKTISEDQFESTLLPAPDLPGASRDIFSQSLSTGLEESHPQEERPTHFCNFFLVDIIDQIFSD